VSIWRAIDDCGDDKEWYIHHYTQFIVRRRYWPTWRERLFTRPWRPWRKAWLYDGDERVW
jgi:hypothetical protein